MELTVKEMQLSNIEKIVDYFLNADAAFLKGMGADKNKLPKRQEWIDLLTLEFYKPYEEKAHYYIIWHIDKQPVGHSNINKIKFGQTAAMHLQLWYPEKRNRGFGVRFLKKTLPFYFENFQLKKLICEPYAENVAPNRTLKKVGFQFIKTYETTPGWINFHQTVTRYEMTPAQFINKSNQNR